MEERELKEVLMVAFGEGAHLLIRWLSKSVSSSLYVRWPHAHVHIHLLGKTQLLPRVTQNKDSKEV